MYRAILLAMDSGSSSQLSDEPNAASISCALLLRALKAALAKLPEMYSSHLKRLSPVKAALD
jgi:hypothetical protein